MYRHGPVTRSRIDRDRHLDRAPVQSCARPKYQFPFLGCRSSVSIIILRLKRLVGWYGNESMIQCLFSALSVTYDAHGGSLTDEYQVPVNMQE
jgi:hypothetical protein